MSERKDIARKFKITVTPHKGEPTEKETSLPFLSETKGIKKMSVSSEITLDGTDPGTRTFVEFTSRTGNVKMFMDGTELLELPCAYAPVRAEVTDFADGNTHELLIKAEPRSGEENELYLSKISAFTVGDSFFDIADRGDCGITVTSAISESAADIIVTAHIVNPNNYDVLRCTLFAPDGTETVKTCKPTSPVCIFSPEKVFLWNGQHEAPLYSVKAELLRDTRLLDSTELRFGVRKTGFNDGFLMLNGVKLPLNGVVLRDFSSPDDDRSLFEKLDANCIKVPVFSGIDTFLSHCDENGTAVWVDMTEPHKTDPNRTHAVIEMLAHHPSFMFASVSTDDGDLLRSFCDAVKAAAGGVFTAGDASFPNEEKVTDALPDVLAVTVPSDTPLEGFLELGEKFSDFIGDRKLRRTAVFAEPPEGFFDRHSEDAARADCSQEYFSSWHEKFWQSFCVKKGVFGCFAGFLSDKDIPAGRTGLTSSDRYDKKDAFWFYKAQFSAEQFIKICSSGMTMTDKKYTDIRCYTNAHDITLTVNGKPRALPCEEISNCVYVFRHVKLKRKNNIIVLTSGDCTDSTVIYRSKSKLKKI